MGLILWLSFATLALAEAKIIKSHGFPNLAI